MPEHRLAKHVEGFHHPSYLVGVIAAFAEVVAVGCKRLALSSPLTEEQYREVREAAELAAEEYGTPLLVERDLLVTRLFPADIAEGLVVILIAHDEGVLEEYRRLKEEKRRLEGAGALTGEAGEEIARRFGRLLSYDDASIDRLLRERV